MATGKPTGFHGAFHQSMSWFHTWLGLLLGVVLYFMFVTGTTGYAHLEITRWMTPELGKQTATTLPHSAEEMFEAGLALALERLPGAPAVYLGVPTGADERGGGDYYVYADPPEPAEGQEAAEALDTKLDPQTLGELGGGTPVRETAGGETLSSTSPSRPGPR